MSKITYAAAACFLVASVVTANAQATRHAYGDYALQSNAAKSYDLSDRDRIDNGLARSRQTETGYVHPGFYSGSPVYGSAYEWGTSDFRNHRSY